MTTKQVARAARRLLWVLVDLPGRLRKDPGSRRRRERARCGGASRAEERCVGEAYRLADGVCPQEAAEAISRLTNLCAPLDPEWDDRIEAMSLVEGVDISTHGDKAMFQWRENHGQVHSCRVFLTSIGPKLVGKVAQTKPDRMDAVSGFRVGMSAWYIEFSWTGSEPDAHGVHGRKQEGLWRYLIVAPEED